MSFCLFKSPFVFQECFPSYRFDIFLKFTLNCFIFLMLLEMETSLPPYFHLFIIFIIVYIYKVLVFVC